MSEPLALSLTQQMDDEPASGMAVAKVRISGVVILIGMSVSLACRLQQWRQVPKVSLCFHFENVFFNNLICYDMRSPRIIRITDKLNFNNQ